MKKLSTIILFTVLLFNGSAFSKIIELNKCYLDKDRSVIKFRETYNFKSFDDFNNKSKQTNYHICKDLDYCFNKEGKREVIKTFNVPYEDILFRISTKQGTVKRIFVITDDGLENYRKYLKELRSIKMKLSKEGKELPYPVKYADVMEPLKKIRTQKGQKILEFYEKKIVYDDKDGRTDTWTLDLNTGIATAFDGRKILKMICQVGGKKRSHYLDYWWAVILIIAITFFIFTQSGKRLKKIRRK